MAIRLDHFPFIAMMAGCVGFGSLGILAQNTSSQHLDQGSSKMMNSADTTFAMKAAQGGLAEVQMGKLAAEKASNSEVKAFGQQMVDDHTKANDDLKAVATKKGMTLPNDVDAHDHATYSKLEKLSGEAFDRAYVKDMVSDHEKDVKEFQKEAKNGKDDDIKAFASRTQPVLQGHLDKIKSIQTNMHAGGASSK